MSTAYNRGIDIARDIDPLHWYRPINSSTWTTLVSGKVDTLKDNGSAGTPLNLQQTTDASRFTHSGKDSATGQEYMTTTTGGHYMDDVVGAVADWKFLSNGAKSTIAIIYKTGTLATTGTILGTNQSLGTTEIGMDVRVGTAGYRHLIADGTNWALASAPNWVPPNSTMGCMVVRTFDYIASAGVSQPQDDMRICQLRVNGIVMSDMSTNQNTPNTGNPAHVLRVGNINTTGGPYGMIGDIYEIILDDAFWNDETVRDYERRAMSKFGVPRFL